MKSEAKFEIESKEKRELVLLGPVLEKTYPPAANRSVSGWLRRFVIQLRSALTLNSSKFGEAEWRRLEYRNEMPTREGERMNHFGIR
jgi:hypothetical protein